jgi:hypothetical protein
MLGVLAWEPGALILVAEVLTLLLAWDDGRPSNMSEKPGVTQQRNRHPIAGLPMQETEFAGQSLAVVLQQR